MSNLGWTVLGVIEALSSQVLCCR